MKVRCEIGVEIPSLPDKRSVEEYLDACKFCVYNGAHDDILTDVYSYTPVDEPLPDSLGDKRRSDELKEIRDKLIQRKDNIVNALYVYNSEAFDNASSADKEAADRSVTELIDKIFSGNPPIKKLSIISFGPKPDTQPKECWTWDKEVAEDLYGFLLDSINNKLRELDNAD